MHYNQLSPPPIISVEGEVLIPEEKRCVPSMNGKLAGAALFQGGVFFPRSKRKKEVDANHFHVFLIHAHLGVLKAIAQQHRIRLVGKLLATCSWCSQAKGIRGATPHHTTTWARESTELINIDTVEPYPKSLRG